MSSNEFRNSWDIDVFRALAKASVKAGEGGWIGYKDLFDKERPCNGVMYFGMSIDNLVGLKYVSRFGTQCTLTDTGLKRFNELKGA